LTSRPGGIATVLRLRALAKPLATLPGTGRSYRFLRRSVYEPLLERMQGVDTAATVGYPELGFGPERGNAYQASNWWMLPAMLDSGEVSGEDVFADFGSGKGRVVYQAATQYTFGRVIGIELAEGLNVIARRNLERNRDRLRCDFEIVTADLMEYVVPDDLTVAYFFNPAVDEPFRAAVDHIIESLRRRPRKLTLIYGNPVMHDYLEARGFCVVRKAGEGEFHVRRYSGPRAWELQ
jgi:histone methylation protein DOT1